MNGLFTRLARKARGDDIGAARMRVPTPYEGGAPTAALDAAPPTAALDDPAQAAAARAPGAIERAASERRDVRDRPARRRGRDGDAAGAGEPRGTPGEERREAGESRHHAGDPGGSGDAGDATSVRIAPGALAPAYDSDALAPAYHGHATAGATAPATAPRAAAAAADSHGDRAIAPSSPASRPPAGQRPRSASPALPLRAGDRRADPGDAEPPAGAAALDDDGPLLAPIPPSHAPPRDTRDRDHGAEPRRAAAPETMVPEARPIVRVTIGRVDVRGTPPAAPAARPAPSRHQALGLDEYLRRRDGGPR